MLRCEMEKALRDWMDAQDAEMWNAERLMQGEPHPCDTCDVGCSTKCRFYFVKGYARNPINNRGTADVFRMILDAYTRRAV